MDQGKACEIKKIINYKLSNKNTISDLITFFPSNKGTFKKEEKQFNCEQDMLCNKIQNKEK